MIQSSDGNQYYSTQEQFAPNMNMPGHSLSQRISQQGTQPDKRPQTSNDHPGIYIPLPQQRSNNLTTNLSSKKRVNSTDRSDLQPSPE